MTAYRENFVILLGFLFIFLGGGVINLPNRKVVSIYTEKRKWDKNPPLYRAVQGMS